MRVIYLFLACSIFLFQGCNSNDDPDKSEKDFVNGAWNLRNISGGIAGINEDFEEGNVVWAFNVKSGILKINITNGTEYNGPKAGTYSFKIVNSANTFILYIGESEFGGIDLLKDELIIDQNIMSNGSGADGFAFKLQK